MPPPLPTPSPTPTQAGASDPSAAFDRSPVSAQHWDNIDSRLQRSRNFFGSLLQASPIKATASRIDPQNSRPWGPWRADSAVPDTKWLASADSMGSVAHRTVELETEVVRLRGAIDEREDELASVMQDYADRTRYLQGKLEAVAVQQRDQQRKDGDAQRTIEQLANRLKLQQERRDADESKQEQQSIQVESLAKELRTKLAEKDAQLSQNARTVTELQSDLVACNSQLMERISAAAAAETSVKTLTKENSEIRREASEMQKEAEVQATRQHAALANAETIAELLRSELAAKDAELVALRAESGEQSALMTTAEAKWRAEQAAAKEALNAKQQAVQRLTAALSESEAERNAHADKIRQQLQQIDRLSLRLRVIEADSEGGQHNRNLAIESVHLGDQAAHDLAALRVELHSRDSAVAELSQVVKRQEVTINEMTASREAEASRRQKLERGIEAAKADLFSGPIVDAATNTSGGMSESTAAQLQAELVAGEQLQATWVELSELRRTMVAKDQKLAALQQELEAMQKPLAPISADVATVGDTHCSSRAMVTTPCSPAQMSQTSSPTGSALLPSAEEEAQARDELELANQVAVEQTVLAASEASARGAAETRLRAEISRREEAESRLQQAQAREVMLQQELLQTPSVVTTAVEESKAVAIRLGKEQQVELAALRAEFDGARERMATEKLDALASLRAEKDAEARLLRQEKEEAERRLRSGQTQAAELVRIEQSRAFAAQRATAAAERVVAATEQAAAETKRNAEASERELRWQLQEASKVNGALESAVTFYKAKAEAQLESTINGTKSPRTVAEAMSKVMVDTDLICGEEEHRYQLQKLTAQQQEAECLVAKLRELLSLEQQKSREAEVRMNDALLAADRAASEREREEAAYELLRQTRSLLAAEREARLAEVHHRQGAEAELDAARAVTNELKASTAAQTADMEKAYAAQKEAENRADAQMLRFDHAESQDLETQLEVALNEAENLRLKLEREVVVIPDSHTFSESFQTVGSQTDFSGTQGMPADANANGTSGSTENVSDRLESDNLPEGWTEHFDPTHRRSYFVHRKHHMTQWERPTAAFASTSELCTSQCEQTNSNIRTLEIQLVSSQKALADANEMLAAEQLAHAQLSAGLEAAESEAKAAARKLEELQLKHQAELLAETERGSAIENQLAEAEGQAKKAADDESATKSQLAAMQAKVKSAEQTSKLVTKTAERQEASLKKQIAADAQKISDLQAELEQARHHQRQYAQTQEARADGVEIQAMLQRKEAELSEAVAALDAAKARIFELEACETELSDAKNALHAAQVQIVELQTQRNSAVALHLDKPHSQGDNQTPEKTGANKMNNESGQNADVTSAHGTNCPSQATLPVKASISEKEARWAVAHEHYMLQSWFTTSVLDQNLDIPGAVELKNRHMSGPIEATFADTGPLGIVFAAEGGRIDHKLGGVYIKHIRAGSAASRMAELGPGMILYRLRHGSKDVDVTRLPYDSAIKEIRSAGRPLVLIFRSPLLSRQQAPGYERVSQVSEADSQMQQQLDTDAQPPPVGNTCFTEGDAKRKTVTAEFQEPGPLGLKFTHCNPKEETGVRLLAINAGTQAIEHSDRLVPGLLLTKVGDVTIAPTHPYKDAIGLLKQTSRPLVLEFEAHN